jgi:ribosomal protein S18 acetylase RimI-like enzyme
MGALTMTLHVFAANTRARGLYENTGYDGELMRYIKHLDDPGPA